MKKRKEGRKKDEEEDSEEESPTLPFSPVYFEIVVVGTVANKIFIELRFIAK